MDEAALQRIATLTRAGRVAEDQLYIALEECNMQAIFDHAGELHRLFEQQQLLIHTQRPKDTDAMYDPQLENVTMPYFAFMQHLSRQQTPETQRIAEGIMHMVFGRIPACEGGWEAHEAREATDRWLNERRENKA